jgi:hypothetical protein
MMNVRKGLIMEMSFTFDYLKAKIWGTDSKMPGQARELFFRAFARPCLF